MVDLRSDTVTKPSEEMRRAMAAAKVGDDVFGDDPTMNLLQERVADMLDKEAALFVPSGTMGNLLAIMTHPQPGDEIIVERESHTFNYEVGGAAALAGVQINPLPGTRGILEPLQIENAIRQPNVHIPQTRLLILENTHNRGSGAIYPLEKIKEISKIAKKHNIRMHLDGARLFNACVATGLEPKNYAQYFDSVMFCFSKGLGAPIGSILVGEKSFIEKAHRNRKMLGGGMRQVGILAAAALYALDHNVERLAEDHANAKKLAGEIAKISNFDVNPEHVETNIVVFDVVNAGLTAEEVVAKMTGKGILLVPFGKTLVRAVTSLAVDSDDIQRALDVLHELFD
ncbi:MAG: low-specificity L-threonine aldolase [Calditrichaeota bacterium]|nr:low-specificity L-threonine aldolase [Calditrichota bacterium]